MPPRAWRFRISDMLEAVHRIRAYTAAMTFETFSERTIVQDAVVRNFEILGEAANNLPDHVIATYPNLPWAELRGMRNILAHEYFNVSLPIIWHTIEHDLLPLVPLLEAIRSSLDEHAEVDV